MLLVAAGHGGNCAGTYFERYERLTADSFRMTYELSRDGVKWQLGDSLVFSRAR